MQKILEQLNQQNHPNGVAGAIAAEASQNAMNGFNERWHELLLGTAASSSSSSANPSTSTSMNSPPRQQPSTSCSECKQLKKEVAEIKMIVTQLLLSPGGTNNTAALAHLLNSANIDAASPSNNNNNGTGQNSTNSRKRSANFTNSQQQHPQPECPVALRPAISNCGNLNGSTTPFFSQWSATSPWQNILAAATLRTSPTLPGAAPSTETPSASGTGGANETKQWSSPSSVDSTAKVDSSAGDSNIDPVGMDGSESSSTSSTCTQGDETPVAPSTSFSALLPSTSSPPLQQFQNDVLNSLLAAQAAAAQNSINQGFDIKPMISDLKPMLSHTPMVAAMHSNGVVTERKPRKQISDDYVKLIRQQHDMSGKKITDIQIPVPEALECDPTFTAVSEQQIVQQIIQTKKFDEMNIKEATTQLCKKLAEKRVFGPRLMAQTTVAGPNHSTYNNLPDEGIIYIQHVCRQVLKDKLSSEEEFWDVFREAMRKLAARCRRVRHAKKTKSLKESVISLAQSDPLAFLKKEQVQEWADAVRIRAQAARTSSPDPILPLPLHNDLNAQVSAALPSKFELIANYET